MWRTNWANQSVVGGIKSGNMAASVNSPVMDRYFDLTERKLYRLLYVNSIDATFTDCFLEQLVEFLHQVEIWRDVRER